MYLSQTNLEKLRDKVENQGGFHIALCPMQPATFQRVKEATDNLYQQLTENDLSVFVDDRGKRPREMFEVIAFLKIRHRVVISGRSLEAGVVEYKDLQTDAFQKIAIDDIGYFLKSLIHSKNN